MYINCNGKQNKQTTQLQSGTLEIGIGQLTTDTTMRVEVEASASAARRSAIHLVETTVVPACVRATSATSDSSLGIAESLVCHGLLCVDPRTIIGVGEIGHEVEFAVVGMESTERTATRKAMNKMRPTHATGAPSSVSANGAAASDFVFQRGECQLLSSLLS